MTHHAAPSFWKCYQALPAEIQRLADKNFAFLKGNPAHPSVQFKRVKSSRLRSARVGDHYRALATDCGDAVLWFWIGTHEAYNQIIRR